MISRFWTDDWFDGFWRTNYTFGEFVDTQRFDVINGVITPRRDYQERLLKQKDEELKKLEADYERRKKEITEERESLLKNKSLAP